MSYRCVATSVAGFIQQLAVGYITNGYYYYVSGVIPSNKPAERVDRKILADYGIAISKWTRARRKKEGHASVQYLRYGRFFVIIATDGVHPFFAAEAKRLRDVRRTPIAFLGYSIGCRPERGGGALHASVRIHEDYYSELKGKFIRAAAAFDHTQLCQAFLSLPFEPYAPVRGQLRGLLRAVNRLRAVAGLERVPRDVLRLGRSPVRPFEPEDSETSSDQARPARTIESRE